MYTIIETTDKDYLCICQIQDGNERWSERSLGEAVDSMIRSAKTLNHTTIEKKDIVFYRQERVVTTELVRRQL